MARVSVLARYFEHKCTWCLMLLMCVWLYLLYSRSYGAFAGMTAFVLIMAYAAVDEVVSNDITARDDFLQPEIK